MNRPGRRLAPRRLAFGTSLLALALLVAACDAPSAGASTTGTTVPWVVGTGGTLRLGIDVAPTGCNPDIAAGDTWADRFVLAPVLPSAFQVTRKDNSVYDSAVIDQAELQSTTPQTVVYSINPKAVWSDGTPITAADFIYTWRAQRGTGGPIGATTPSGSSSTTTTASGAAAPPTPTPTAPTPGPVGPTTLPGATGTTGTLMGYRQIKSVTGSNHGRTVTVVFSTRYADWHALFDDLLPAHVLEKTGWTPACTTVKPSIDLSGGPYLISRVVPGKKVVLSRNPRWWEQRPNLKRIVIETARSSGQLASWLASGKIQMAVPTSFDQQFLERVTSSPRLQSQTSQSTTFLQLELSATSPVTSSASVREAIAHAINRQQLVDQVTGWADMSIVPAASHLYAESQNGYPSPKQLPMQLAGQTGSPPTTVPATPTPSQPYPTSADPAATSRLLTEAGYVRGVDGTWRTLNGQPLTLRIAVDTGDGWAARAATVLAQQLDAAGISAVLTDEPTATRAGTALASGNVDAALLPMHASAYSTTAIAWYTDLLGPPGQDGSQDWANYDNPTLDGLLVKASKQLNPDTADPIYTQADMLLWQDMIALPLFTEPSVVAWSTSVGGVSPDLNGPNLLTSVSTWGMRVPPTSARAKGASGTTSSS